MNHNKNNQPIKVPRDMDKIVLRAAFILIIVLLAIWYCPLPW